MFLIYKVTASEFHFSNNNLKYNCLCIDKYIFKCIL